jgi:hypothetical protein
VYSNYVVITKNKLHVAKSLKEINKQAKGMIEDEEFKAIGEDFIINLSDDDINFVQDKKRMSNIPWQSMISKDKTLNYLLYVVIVLCGIGIIRG